MTSVGGLAHNRTRHGGWVTVFGSAHFSGGLKLLDTSQSCMGRTVLYRAI